MVKFYLTKKERFSNLNFLVLAYSFDGIIVFVLLTICTCGYMRRVPKLREWFFSEKKGFAGIFYKGKFFLLKLCMLITEISDLSRDYFIFRERG